MGSVRERVWPNAGIWWTLRSMSPPDLAVAPARRRPATADTPRLSVLIGADSLAHRRSGIARMTLEIARAARSAPEIRRVSLLMAGQLAPVEVIDTLDREPPPAVKPIPWKVALGRVPGVQAMRALRHAGLARRTAELARDCAGRLVYHEPNMIASPIRLPTVVTMNDLSWHHHPSWHPAERLRWIGRNLDATLRQARRFAAISRFTRDTVIREFGIEPGRIDLIPLAPAAEFRPVGVTAAAATLARFELADRAYVLSISTLEPRKNFDRLLAAHLALPYALRHRHPLVIAGGRGWGEVLARPEAQTAIRDGSVRLLGHVDDADLVVLTARAAVFAYVSLYEGFGLPVVEAMAAGCPVVASSTTAVGEIATGAALTVDPLDVAAIAAALRELIEDPDRAERLREAGLARAAGYTWRRTVETLVTCWDHAL